MNCLQTQNLLLIVERSQESIVWDISGRYSPVDPLSVTYAHVTHEQRDFVTSKGGNCGNEFQPEYVVDLLDAARGNLWYPCGTHLGFVFLDGHPPRCQSRRADAHDRRRLAKDLIARTRRCGSVVGK
jgi:hypothetical protein